MYVDFNRLVISNYNRILKFSVELNLVLHILTEAYPFVTYQYVLNIYGISALSVIALRIYGPPIGCLHNLYSWSENSRSLRSFNIGISFSFHTHPYAIYPSPITITITIRSPDAIKHVGHVRFHWNRCDRDSHVPEILKIQSFAINAHKSWLPGENINAIMAPRLQVLILAGTRTAGGRTETLWIFQHFRLLFYVSDLRVTQHRAAEQWGSKKIALWTPQPEPIKHWMVPRQLPMFMQIKICAIK